jgi:hypothetical protein
MFLWLAALGYQEAQPEHIYAAVVPSVAMISVEKVDGTVGTGTAFLALQDGIAVTAWHVVNGASRAVLKFSDGEEFESSGIIDKDVARDLAIIRVKVAGRPRLQLATKDAAVGSRAYVVGNPRGLEFTISDGLVSQLQLLGGSKQIQFSCPVSPGSSGSPLINGRGEVVGVVSWQRIDGQNLNFATPSVYAAGLDATLPTTRWQDLPRPAAQPPTLAATGPPAVLERRGASDPRTAILSAKSVAIIQTIGNPELAVAVERELHSWNSWMVVSDASRADLILRLAPTSGVNLWLGKGAKAVATLTTNDGVRIWTTVKGGDWSMAGYSFPKVGKAIVQDLRKFVAATAKK